MVATTPTPPNSADNPSGSQCPGRSQPRCVLPRGCWTTMSSLSRTASKLLIQPSLRLQSSHSSDWQAGPTLPNNNFTSLFFFSLTKRVCKTTRNAKCKFGQTLHVPGEFNWHLYMDCMSILYWLCSYSRNCPLFPRYIVWKDTLITLRTRGFTHHFDLQLDLTYHHLVLGLIQPMTVSEQGLPDVIRINICIVKHKYISSLVHYIDISPRIGLEFSVCLSEPRIRQVSVI